MIEETCSDFFVLLTVPFLEAAHVFYVGKEEK